jgi:hypothetical protein
VETDVSENLQPPAQPAEPTSSGAGAIARGAQGGPSAAGAEAHPLRRPRILVPLLALLLVVHLPFWHYFLRGAAEVTQAVPFTDDFNRATLGNDYWSNGGHWRLADGQLFSPGVGNNPLWLKARLPADVRIEFDVRSEGPDGDVKWEAFGDGRNHSTGYLFLFGAWRNRESRICKLEEHASTESETKAQLAGLVRPFPRVVPGLAGVLDSIWAPVRRWQARRDLDKLESGTFYGKDRPFVVKRMDLKVQKGRTYHVVVTKKGGDIRWTLDGELALEMKDPSPLSGRGHDRFGFSSWQNDTYFDNLRIEPL